MGDLPIIHHRSPLGNGGMDSTIISRLTVISSSDIMNVFLHTA
jgi:hypothetical protein